MRLLFMASELAYNYLPHSLLGLYRSYNNPIEEDAILHSFALAKYKEALGLIEEIEEQNSSYYPTQLRQILNEFIGIYQETNSFKALLFSEQNELKSLTSYSEPQLMSRLKHSKVGHMTLLSYLTQGNTLAPSKTASSNDPLSHTDLLVYPDDYYGPLPRNGIFQREYEKVQKLYQNIVERQTRIQVQGKPNFQVRVFKHIKKLLTRAEGRELIQSLVSFTTFEQAKNLPSWSSHSVTIVPTAKQSFAQRLICGKPQKSPSKDSFIELQNLGTEYNHKAYISITKPAKALTETASGLEYYPMPPLIEFAHELIHLRHFMRFKSWQALDPKEIKGYTNEIEKVAITGQLNGQEKDAVSENSLRKAFGFLPRRYHY